MPGFQTTEAMEHRLRYAISEALFRFGLMPEFILIDAIDWESDSLSIKLEGICPRDEWARRKHEAKRYGGEQQRW